MRFGIIQGVAIWEMDMVAVIFISPSTQLLQLQLNSYSSMHQLAKYVQWPLATAVISTFATAEK